MGTRLPSERHAPLILGCAGLQDPGNLGTILRSAEAFGASGVLTTEGTVSSANPKVARASAGSVFRLPVVKLSTAQALDALADHGIRLAVTSCHQGRPVQEIDLTLPTAIFIGSEGHGVPRALLDPPTKPSSSPTPPKSKASTPPSPPASCSTKPSASGANSRRQCV